MALSDEPMTEPMPDDPNPNGNGASPEPQAVDVEAAQQPQRELEESLVEESKQTAKPKEPEIPEENGKSDSEAETEILSGKEDDPGHKSRKAIKLEEAEDSNSDAEGSKDKAEQSDPLAPLGARKSSLKRKRGSEQPQSSDVQDELDSSKLSSTISSPVIDRRTSDDIDSKSDQSESSPPIEDDTRQRDSKSMKRRLDNEKARKHNTEHIRDSVNGRKRRDTRSGTDFDETAHRSTSPTPRKAHRAQSSQSNTSQPQGVKKRKKAPAPLHVDRRSRPLEDTHDSDSSSAESHHPTKTPRGGIGDGTAIWKAQKVSKTNKDRSGRTRLARACASGIPEDVLNWLKERSEDIDVADFAGNTPLQVASLEGYEEIVKLLLEAGCSTDSKNVDGDTPLIDAVENGHLEVVRLLLDAGVDPMQRSQSGKEPIELVNPEMDDADQIRAALAASKKDKDGRRRQSEDHSRSKASAPREVEASSMANSGPSPTHSTRSPPFEPGPKRRTARSQHTGDNLLWVNPTPQRLRDAAGKGDINIVNHILGMRPLADTEALVAAAQGGHDEVLGLMLAIAQPEADPSPLRSGNLKPGYTTPLLAAIGGGNVKVLDLLVHQPGFDPTRRMFKNLTYYELAKERQGSEWQEEYDLLKDAYDQYKRNGGRRSNHTSPNKVRAKRTESRKSSPEPSSSPHEVRKIRRPRPTIKEEHDEESKEEPKEMSKEEPRRRPSYQGTALKRPEESRKLPSIASDHETEIRLKGKESKLINRVRSTSPSQPVQKARRRLMSGNDVKTGQEFKRKTSLTAEDKERRRSGDSITSHGARPRKSSDASNMSAPPTKKASSESPRRTKEEAGKKRLRTSTSPQASRADAIEAITKKKRQRVDSHGNAVDQGKERPTRLGPAPPANVVLQTSNTSSPRPSPAPASSAPVAFMGSATASPATKSPVQESSAEPQPKSAMISPTGSIDTTMKDATNEDEDEAKGAADEVANRVKQEEEERHRQEQLEKDKAIRAEAEERQQVEAEKQAQLQKEREAAELEAQIAREKEEEIERQAQEEQRRQREELEAQAKKRREEEMRERRAEQERQRKIDLERRRREAEEREIALRVKAQQEAEAARRNSLPNGLRRYFELTPDQARSTSEIKKWLPLRTVTTEDLDPHLNASGASERWIANVQAAPLLANKDLELSQYTAWSRRPATSAQQTSLWKQLRNPMAQAVPNAFVSPAEAHALENETLPKFLKLNVFWIKLADFMDIVPRHPHLVGTKLIPQDFVLQTFAFGVPARPREASTGLGIKEEVYSPSITNGNGGMVNGHK